MGGVEVKNSNIQYRTGAKWNCKWCAVQGIGVVSMELGLNENGHGVQYNTSTQGYGLNGG